MKKLIAVFVFLMYVLPMYSQSKDFELYRCSIININSLLSTGEWKDTTYNVSYLLSIELDNSIISFDNASNTTLYISVINSISAIKKDAEDKEYIEIVYFCHDQNNIGCKLTIFTYTELPDRIFKLEYTNIAIIIYAKLIKAANPVPKPIINSSDGNLGIHRG